MSTLDVMTAYAVRRTVSAIAVIVGVIAIMGAVMVHLSSGNPLCSGFAGADPSCSEYPPEPPHVRSGV
jgi:hypothetical protein